MDVATAQSKEQIYLHMFLIEYAIQYEVGPEHWPFTLNVLKQLQLSWIIMEAIRVLGEVNVTSFIIFTSDHFVCWLSKKVNKDLKEGNRTPTAHTSFGVL